MNELILEEGTYLIKNVHLGNYLQIDDNDANNNYFSTNATLEMCELDGNNYQKWQFDYLHSGYYMIKFKCSIKVISVTEGNENISNDALVKKPYTGCV